MLIENAGFLGLGRMGRKNDVNGSFQDSLQKLSGVFNGRCSALSHLSPRTSNGRIPLSRLPLTIHLIGHILFDQIQ